MLGLHFPITADNRNFMNAIHEITAGVQDATRQIEANGGSIDRVISMIKKGVTSIGIGLGFKELSSQIFETRDQFQKLEIAFTTFLGSEEKASSLMQEILHTAAITPFDLAGVADGAKNLLAFGVAAEDVNKTIISLGDVAAGLSQPLGDIIYLYGTTISKPKMDTQDLMQFMGRGIPIAKELAKQFGVAENKVRDLVSAGKVTGDVVKKAFESMTAEGSMFGGLMEAQSKSLGGQYENIKDTIDQIFNEVGKSSEGLFNTVLSSAGTSLEFIQSYLDDIAIAVGTITATYGLNKAALVMVSAFEKSKTNFRYDTEIEELNRLLPLKEEEKKSDIELAVASGQLSKAKAMEIAQLREQADAQLQLLDEKQKAAEKELDLAQSDVDGLTDWKLELDEKIESVKQYMDVLAENAECLEDLADIDEYEAEMEHLNTLATERNSIVNELNSATEKRNALATDASAAAEARDTMQTDINTVSTRTNTATVNLLTMAKNACAKASQKLWAVIAANPIGTTVVALGALYYAMTKLFESEGKAVEMSEKFGESTAKQISRIDSLCDILSGTTRGTKTYKEALSNLNEELKNNGIEQLKESDGLDLINDKRKLAIDLIKQEAVERNRANQIQTNDETYQTSLKDARVQLEKDLSVATTLRGVAGIGINLANEEIRSKAPQIATIISDVVSNNISQIAGKTGKEYEEGVAKIYGEINEKMRRIGLSAETINAEWSKFGLYGNDFLNEYISSVREAAEEHEVQRRSIEDVAQADRDAEIATLSYSDKVEHTSNKLNNCAGDADTLYNSIKSLMDKYRENTIGFTIKFNADVPAWMNNKEIPELQRLATWFTSRGEALKKGQTLNVNGKSMSKQELLQRGADYAQAAKNKSDNIKEKEGRWDTIDNEIKEKKKEAHKYAKGSKEALAIYSEIDKLEAEKKGLGDYDRDHKKKKSSGPTADQLASKEKEAHQKLLDLMKNQSEERLKLQQDYEFQQWQNRIDLMQEGEAKVIAQMELDNKRELSSLEEQKQQAIKAEISRQKALFDAREEEKAAGKKKYAKEVFDPSSIYDPDKNIISDEIKTITARFDSLNNQLILKQKKAESDRIQASNEAMNSYLKEFGTYQEKRLAIQEEYEKKISEAQNEGERMMLTAQRNKAIADLDYSEWVDTGSIALAFGDISKLSDKTISQLISDMEKYREEIIKTFDPDKIQKYEEALAGLRKSQSDKSFGILSSVIPDYFKERKSVGNQMDSASKNLNTLDEEKVKILEKISRLQDLIEITGSNGHDTGNLENQLREANVELDANEEATKKARNAFELLQEQWEQLETPQAKFEALCVGIADVSNLIGGLVNQAAEMCESLGAEGLGETLDYFGDAMGSISNIASGFANGGIVGGIAAAAGEIMGWVGKIFAAGDNRHQKNIEALQDQIDVLQNSYDRLGKAADKAFSTDASHLIDQQNTLLEQQQALIRQQILEEEAKKKTDSDKIKQYKEQLQEIEDTIADNKDKAKEAIIGEDLKSAINEFATLYADAWGTGKNAAEKSMAAVKNIISSALSEMIKGKVQPAAEQFYNRLTEAMSDGILEDWELDELDAIKRQIDAIAAAEEEQYKKIQERYRDLDELKEELTDISFDSVRDNFKSLLSDMASTTADFTNSFSDMLRNALIEGLMSEKYNLMLKEWYDEFAEAMNDRTLTDSERDALRQQYDSIVQQGIADRDFINSIVGGGAYSQEATRGGWETMRQDQADELNGRFTALTELEAINNSLVSEGNMIAVQILDTLRSLSALSMVTDGDNSTLREIRDMMFLSTGHLEDISKYTKQLIIIREGIDKLNDLIDQRL